MSVHKIVNESKKTLQDFKNNPHKYSPFRCKCKSPFISEKYGDTRCQKCGLEIR